MGLIKWLLGDTDEVVDGQYVGDRVPRSRCEPPRIPPGARGMFVDPAQTPTRLMPPSMQPGQCAAPETEPDD